MITEHATDTHGVTMVNSACSICSGCSSRPETDKGESLHALKRDLLSAHEGTVRARHLQQQTEQT